MSDITQPAVDWDSVMRRYHQWESDAAKLIAENKTMLLAALGASGITRVTVTFDGYGDSGQIEDITAFRGDEQVDLPVDPVTLRLLDYGAAEPAFRHLPSEKAIETLAYDLLHHKHCGWENNDGAYGDFTFDVAAGTITLDYNERFTSSENYVDEW